jgi:predicted SAM-dependent methyltransferase
MVKVLTMGPIVQHSVASNHDLDVRGMYGIGDCIFQRAVLRGIMQTKRYDSIILDSYYRDMFWDMEQDGLKINIIKDKGRIRDSDNRSSPKVNGVPPVHAKRKIQQIRLTYDRKSILQHGSILAAMFASANLQMPKQPDFSMPVKPEWIARWRLYFKTECHKRNLKVTKPLMVYRPICLNTRWTAIARAPDPKAYDALYQSIRDQFFVVSIADLRKKDGHEEWTIGPKPDVDLDLSQGELDFATLCGLFADAKLAFTNPGFAPVLAHAVKTPVIIVYGGNETFATTNSVGRHLSPTLAIDIDKPCPCHQQNHHCDKHITLPPAKNRVLEFTKAVLNGEAKVDDKTESFQKPMFNRNQPEALPLAKVLIFGTTYIDTPERAELTRLWYDLHSKINPDCDLLLVDSKSPLFPKDLIPSDKFALYEGGERNASYYIKSESSTPKGLSLIQFKDNVGHLSRNGPSGAQSSGRDGWGRAFSMGLDIARTKDQAGHGLPEGGYDYVVHIEGDSLCKVPVRPIIGKMQREDIKVLTVPVQGTRVKETGWVETGFMFFDCTWLEQSKFTKLYDWANRKPHPTPERVIWDILEKELGIGKGVRVMSWGALRGDKNQITEANIHNLEWVTHLRNHVGLDNVKLFSKYRDAALHGATISEYFMKDAPQDKPIVQPPSPVVQPITGRSASLPDFGVVKINLGCGTNKLPGWQNHDKEVDITRKLPFKSDTADFIFAEHVVEHTPYYTAINFMKECFRVLKPNAVLRITTPSLEFLQQRGDEEYFKWVHSKGWGPAPDKRGAMHAILYSHGHQTAWTASLLTSTMFYCGFNKIEVCEVGKSYHPSLVGVEGHGKVIGDHYNWIESLCVEGTK